MWLKYLPLKSPAIITKTTTLKFRNVKTLFKRDDSLAPTAMANAKSTVTMSAKKSG